MGAEEDLINVVSKIPLVERRVVTKAVQDLKKVVGDKARKEAAIGATNAVKPLIVKQIIIGGVMSIATLFFAKFLIKRSRKKRALSGLGFAADEHDRLAASSLQRSASLLQKANTSSNCLHFNESLVETEVELSKALVNYSAGSKQNKDFLPLTRQVRAEIRKGWSAYNGQCIRPQDAERSAAQRRAQSAFRKEQKSIAQRTAGRRNKMTRR